MLFMQNNFKTIYDKFSRSLYNSKSRSSSGFDHIFLVYDHNEDKVTNFAIRTTNNNLPELIEMLIHEHLDDITSDRKEKLTADEIKAHYKWFYSRIDSALEKRLENK